MSPTEPRSFPSQMINVIQGEYAVTRQPDVTMSTVLGSCIAACVYDPVSRIGGMNHFLLPESKNAAHTSLKYGTYLMELLINDLLKGGADRRQLRAKLFGGARMSQILNDIGGQNIIFGRKFLQREGIPIEMESVGGTQARRIQFVPSSGLARQKVVTNTDEVARAEVRVKAPEPRSDITLF